MKLQSPLKFREEWFLFFSPAFIVIHGFVRFPAAIDWKDIVWLFLEYSFWSILITIIFCWFLSFRKAAFFAFSLVLFNALFGSIYEPVAEKHSSIFFSRFSFILPLVLIFFILFFLFLRKTKYDFQKATRFMNLLFFVLITFEVFQFIQHRMAEARSAVSTGQCKNCPTPDIYLIVTDGYAGKEQLEKYFHFDNRAFEDSLQALGFYVVDSSFSNYSSTSQSMTSLLNMHYNVIEGEDAHVQINQNNTTAFFEKMGYQVHNNSIFKLAEQFPKRPIGYFKTGIGLIRYHTFFAHLEAVIHNSLSNWQVESERQKMQNAIDERTHKESIRDSLTLQELLDGVSPKRSSPKFVYSHFMMPHPPYLFSEDGQQPDTSASPEKQYISYLQYTNKQLLKAAKRILQYSTEPPVIILLSDHGFRNDDLPHPTPFRFSNLVAVYLPNKQRKLFYKGLSNVNIFRVLLNHQFEQNLPFLKDSTCY